MMCAWIALSLLLPGTSSFMIHNTVHSLCLEDSRTTGIVQLKKCSLDSDLQQWVWWDQSVLESVATSRCLSAHHTDPVQTVACEEAEERRGLLWACEGNRLTSQNMSLDLSTDGKRLSLSRRSKQSKWRSLDEGDICQERLRSKRASSEPDEFEVRQEGKSTGLTAMTAEQREFLRWYYRTEDPTPWKFAMLGLSFAALLLGFLLLGMSSMANKNRKKIAKYKAAAVLAQKPEAEQLRVITEVSEHTEVKATNRAPTQLSSTPESPVQEIKLPRDNGEVEGLKPGDIMVTWKDGNVSTLYPEPAVELEEMKGEGVQKEEVEKEEEAEVETEVEVEVEEEVEAAAEMKKEEGQ